MLIPIKLQINIQFNFLTITNHGRSRERKKEAKAEASAGHAKLKKQRRPLEDVQSRSSNHVRIVYVLYTDVGHPDQALAFAPGGASQSYQIHAIV